MNEFLLNMFAGGFTGYVTNNVAIKMLFKEYMGFGGVIEKEYESFIENISKLIEKDLINDETLKDEINNEKFRVSLKNIIEEILLIQLPKINGNLHFYELEGFEESKNNLINFIENEKEPLSKELISVYEEKKLNSFISEVQFKEIVKNLSVEVDKNVPQIKDLVYDFLASKKIDELFSNNVIYKVKDNIKNEVKSINFSEFDGDLNKIYLEFLEVVKIDEVIAKMENSISNMYLRDFINDSDGLSKELISRILKILSSQEGEYLLNHLIENLIESLKMINVSLFDILTPDTSTQIKYFIEDKLPDMINNLVSFIEKNKTDIERRINEDIDKVLDRGIGGKILKVIKNIIYGFIYDDFASEKNLVAGIITAIQSYGGKAGENITKTILEALESHTVGEIVEILDDNGFLRADRLTRIIQVNLKELKAKKIDAIDDFLDKKVKEVINVDLGFLKNEVLVKVFTNIKEKYLYQDRFKNDLNKTLNESIENLKNKRIDDFLNEESLSINLDVSKFLNYSMLDIKVKDIASIKNIEIDYQESLEKVENLKLNELYFKFQKESVYNELRNIAINGINSNLKTIFKDNVSTSVSKELYKFEPSQIRDMVENFMGKELKPINTLGAILGAVAGGGYYGATLLMNNPYLGYATPLIYAGTGVFTNHLAIEMLFKPYEKKWYLPFFSPGVVAKKKPEFAKNIATFVKDDILTDKALNNSFKNHKDTLKGFSINYLSKNNYEVIDNFIKLQIDKISDYTFDMLINYLELNSAKISKMIVEKFGKMDLSEYSASFSKNIVNEIYKLDFNDYVRDYLNSKNLNEFLPYILQIVDGNFDILIEKIVNSLEFENVKKMMLQYESEYKSFTENNTLEYIINEEMKKLIIENLNNKVFELVKNDDLIESTIEKFDRGINPNERLKDAFDGALVGAIDRNIDYLIQQAIEYVQNLKEDVKVDIIKKVSWPILVMLGDKLDDNKKKISKKGRISEIIDKIFDYTIPRFLKNKRDELGVVAKKLLNYRISDLGINASSIDKVKVKETLSVVFESYEFKVSIENLSIIFVDSLLKLKIEDVLKILNIRNFRQFVDIISPILEDGINLVQDNLEKNQNQLKDVSKYFLEIILNDISKDKKLMTLFEGIEVEKEIKILLALFKEKEKDLNYIIEDILNGLFDKDFYSKTLLENDLNEFIKNSIREDKEVIKGKLYLFLKEFISSLNLILDKQLKDRLLNDLSDAVFNSLEKNIEEVIKSIDIKEVIIREINNMHPKEIEDMFYSFAGDYFKNGNASLFV